MLPCSGSGAPRSSTPRERVAVASAAATTSHRGGRAPSRVGSEVPGASAEELPLTFAQRYHVRPLCRRRRSRVAVARAAAGELHDRAHDALRLRSGGRRRSSSRRSGQVARAIRRSAAGRRRRSRAQRGRGRSRRPAGPPRARRAFDRPRRRTSRSSARSAVVMVRARDGSPALGATTGAPCGGEVARHRDLARERTRRPPRTVDVTVVTRATTGAGRRRHEQVARVAQDLGLVAAQPVLSGDRERPPRALAAQRPSSVTAPRRAGARGPTRRSTRRPTRAAGPCRAGRG